MPNLIILIVIVLIFLTGYNTMLLLSLKAKQASLLAFEDRIADLLLRIRMGTIKRKR